MNIENTSYISVTDVVGNTFSLFVSSYIFGTGLVWSAYLSQPMGVVGWCDGAG